MRKILLVVSSALILLMFATGCSDHDDSHHDGPPADADDPDDQPDDQSPVGWWLAASECREFLPDWRLPLPDPLKLPKPKEDTPEEAAAAEVLRTFNDRLTAAMSLPEASYAEKLDALKVAGAEGLPGLLAGLERPAAGGWAKVAVLLADYARSILAGAKAPRMSVAAAGGKPDGNFEMELTDAVLDRFWTYYHWNEILAGYYDDSAYRFVFTPDGRSSFIAEEVGEAGVEMTMDWWAVRRETFDDPQWSTNQLLMIAKYSLWDDPHWGDDESAYWNVEPAFKDEDCTLFTGNVLSSLAFEYALTRLPRTLRRMQAIIRSYRLFDRFRLEGAGPLDQAGYDGRLQRGTKTKNLYHEDEIYLMTIEGTDPIRFSHNNSFPDRLTGRERKNVSRDQYYGLILGYYSLVQVLRDIEDRTPEEEELYCSAVIHMDLILGYLFQNRVRPFWGLLYNLYSLVEGSCANPPNLTFMSFWSYPGFEYMTGRDYTARFGAGNKLIRELLRLGRIIGGIELSQALFHDAHRGLTALNQYMITLYMSDLSPEEWQFIYPPEVLKQNPNWRPLWRRMIALFYKKYGMLGNSEYRQTIEEMFLAENNPPPELSDITWNTQHGYRRIETVGQLEDFLLPLAALASSAYNREAVAEHFLRRYRELVEAGQLDYTDTDLPHPDGT